MLWRSCIQIVLIYAEAFYAETQVLITMVDFCACICAHAWCMSLRVGGVV